MRILLTCLTMVFMAGLQAQHLDTRAFTAGGSSLSFTGGTLEVSVGEMGIQTLSSGNVILTQGLLQPLFRSGVGIVNDLVETAMRVYPNPATDVLRIEIESDNAFQGQIYDERGRVVEAFPVQRHTDFDVSPLSAGAYLLVLTDEVYTRRHFVRFVKR